jgi:uncharacterized membrane protein YkvA (DUF1232 family)
MGSRVTSLMSGPSLLRTLIGHVRMTARLLREPAVPLLLKAIPILTAVYVVSPLDIVPDFFPVVGQLDDLGVVLLGLGSFLKLCPMRAVDFHRSALDSRRPFSPMPADGDVFDADYRREERVR